MSIEKTRENPHEVGKIPHPGRSISTTVDELVEIPR